MTIIDATNMTHEEYYRLNGTMSTERIESLLDAKTEEQLVSFYDDSIDHTHEIASATLPEDFLDELQDSLEELLGELGGQNLETLKLAIDQLKRDKETVMKSNEKITDTISELETHFTNFCL